jgi:hypothetical protein
MNKARLFAILLVLGLAIMVLVAAPTSAHGDREVGEYVLVFGWRVEPAYTTLLNGPEVFVTHHETDEPVEGLEDTLQLEVSFGPASKMLTLRAVFGEPGHYTADLIPTQAGDYSFHMTGTIGETEVDEIFDSADGEFSSVEPVSDIMFP